MLEGSCHCGAIRYEIAGDPINHMLCHCSDCRRASGAPVVGWLMVDDKALTIEGEPSIYASSESGRRHFCVQCGTGLFYSNAEMLLGLVDVQSATLDEPENILPEAHIQVADRIAWMNDVQKLPEHQRYPEPE
ncbi:hypothetical protein HME9302_01405 [Alteripontixanthobacter maritimus]|uniref:CENP-V/GFA domain-containing protein n=2 Tax=Alteripontixanthobacter maritimus TaxID=2161824 RepID=A0A369Q9H4_9SPHN|nr:hypothetical protein HME9302_01405 [Alteripontixanthobacter maritimus]